MCNAIDVECAGCEHQFWNPEVKSEKELRNMSCNFLCFNVHIIFINGKKIKEVFKKSIEARTLSYYVYPVYLLFTRIDTYAQAIYNLTGNV